MADEELWQTLLRFHREIVKPDIEAIVDTRLEPIRAAINEVNGQFDHIYHRLDRIETDRIAELEKQLN